MIDLNEFSAINPKDPYNPYEKKPFEDFAFSFKQYLPNFPDNVIEQWPYRHFDDFCRHYWYLDFETFEFRHTKFSLDDIFNIKTRMTDKDVKDWGNNYLNRHKNHLETYRVFDYMSRNKSWEQPIIVLDTKTCPNDKREALHCPFHLLEGHMRLSVLLAKIRNNEPVSCYHDVWLVRMERA